MLPEQNTYVNILIKCLVTLTKLFNTPDIEAELEMLEYINAEICADYSLAL